MKIGPVSYRVELGGPLKISVETKFWRDVLTRIIKIILFLTAGYTALQVNE